MNTLLRRHWLTIAVTCLAVGTLYVAQASADEPKTAEQATHTVEESPLKIVVQLDGTAVAEKMTEVAVDPESWSDWTVEDAVAHGVQVRKGDVLVRFDTKKIDEAIADLEMELELLDLTITQADRELPLFEKTLAMDTEDAERALRITMEDTQHYLDVEKELAKKNTEFSLKSTKQRYENTLEELVQLEKMYESDDLIEETEEIILKRQRHSVAAAKLSLERATVAHDRALRVGLPRTEESTQRKLARSELSTAKATRNVELALKQKQLEHAKQKIKRDRQHEKLAKLQHDREAMIVHAPAAGTVYYGPCVDGKWGKITTLRSKLRAHGKVQAHEILMTIVSDGPNHVVATVPEADLSELKPGMKAALTFPALGDDQVEGRVESLSSTIVSAGKFAIQLTLDNDGRVAGLTPGMSGKIKLVAYANRNALLVPQSAVLTDPWNDEDQSVFLVDDEGNETKKSVETGHKKGDQIEVVSGLDVGDRILKNAKGQGE